MHGRTSPVSANDFIRDLHMSVRWSIKLPLFVSSPTLFLGLKEGESHVVRNAGGRAQVLISWSCTTLAPIRIHSSEGLRNVVVSQQLLGTREIVVIHHVRIVPNKPPDAILNSTCDKIFLD